MANEGLYSSHDGSIDFKAYSYLYDKTFDEIRAMRDNVPREGAQFFATETTNLETYKVGEEGKVLQVPQKNEDTDRIPLIAPVEGFYKEFTNIQRRSGYVITDRAISAQKTRMIMQMIQGLPNSAARVEELSYATIFNNGFTTETTGDGQAVFDTAHKHPGTEFGTYSNEAASGGGFTTDTFFAGRLNLNTRKNEKGFVDPMLPQTVICPPDLEESVLKVMASKQYPQNALNAVMPEPIFKSWTVVVMHWLTSTTAWFIKADVPESERGFCIVWETRPNYKDLKDSMNPEIVSGKRLLMRHSVGALHARDWYANVGA